MSLSVHRAVRTIAFAAAVAVSAGVVLVPPLASSAEPAAGPGPAVGPPTVKTVTLVTGDVVEVSTGADGKQSVVILPRADGSIPQAAINRVHDHLYVVPTEAFGLLQGHRLDSDLFDVTTLIADGYDDASRATLPVIIDYGKGRVAAAESRKASLKGAKRAVSVPELGMTGFHAKKKDARAFWADLTTGADAAGNPTALSDGAARVDLDGRVQVALEHSVPQIHAPQAWAAGFDGAGTTVAVLDSGYDATHPDLAGRVGATANFTEESSVKDGHGHGTHVASTVAGSGAASDGLRKGVAPRTTLMIGKVLNDHGSGQDSMVLAGMVWAVDQGADVVSMSLGGDADDGTSPLAQAINELSATSDTLFVVAAGNNGSKPSTVTTPGSADAALTVGAVDVNDVMARFSSRGPRLNNGGFKPEVVAPGVNITAARAAGTALGPIVDDAYTTISGTSMATPHVAGLAALLKQEHPGWDGDQIKSVIANSTLPVAHATGFDAGTGRIDALAAIHQTVLAPATRSLGYFRWPQADLKPTRTALTYTNTAATAVTLSLALTGQDGSPEPTGAISLADDHVTVPAGGTASVDVIVDPRIAAPGAYSAVVTATPDNGGGTVRTGVAYTLEKEAYDVKVTVKPRTGTQSASHALFLNSMSGQRIYESRYFDASPDAQTVTFRLPPGKYNTYATSAGLAADGAKEGALSYEPSFTVSKDAEIVLDENKTARFGYDVKRPVVTDAAVLLVSTRDTGGAYSEFAYYGAPDRAYARPSAGLGATASISSNWWLSQPEGVLSPAEGQPLALRSLPATAGTPAETAPAEIDASFPIVDAGRAAAPSTSKVKGAVAFVSGTCDDLTPAATALKKAGAAAMVAYAGPGQTCAGTIDGTVGLPSLQARAIDAADLLPNVRNARADLVTHKVPEYMYDLLRYWKDEVPNGGIVDGSSASTSALVERYNSLGSTSADGLTAAERLIGWVPDRGIAVYGYVHPVPVPATVTHYVSTGAAWERSVDIQDVESGAGYAFLWAPRTTYAAGTTNRDTWFGGPISTGVSPLKKVDNGSPPPTRFGNVLYISMGAIIDGAGHQGDANSAYTGKVYSDGALKRTAGSPSSLNGVFVGSGAHRIRVVTEVAAQPDDPFWQRSTAIKTEWGFDSEQPAGQYAVLPMLGINYQLPGLSSTTTAPAGEYAFDVKLSMPDTVETRPVVQRSVEISWDGGQTWAPAKLTKCDDTSCKAHVTNQPGGRASLRVSATDAGGSTVTQEITNAYAVPQ
jgi:subtilisin family serine protease